MTFAELAAHHAKRAESGDPTINPVMAAQLAFTYAALALLEAQNGKRAA